MADTQANPHVEQMKVKAEIASLEHTIARQTVQIMELDHKRERTIVNLKASKKAIGEREEQLEAMIEAHGEAKPPKL